MVRSNKAFGWPPASLPLTSGPDRGRQLPPNSPQTRSEQATQVARSRSHSKSAHAAVRNDLRGPSVGESGGEGRPGCASVASVLGGLRGTPHVHCHCDDSADSAAADRPAEPGLGSLTGYCPQGVKDAGFRIGQYEGPNRKSSGDGLLHSFELRNRLRPIAVSPRIAICGSRIYTDPQVITDELADGTRIARWTGVVLCNRAGCPVCGPAKARRFREHVLRALGGGGLWQHVIFTVPHHAGESWAAVYERAMEGLRSNTKGLAGRVLRDVVLGTIRATETTWGENGWHVHFHVLWHLRRPLLLEETRIIRRQWRARTGATIRRGVRFGATFEGERDRQQAAHYLSKIALEMSGAAKIPGKDNRTLGDVYRDAANGSERAIQLVQQYQRQTKGRRLYQLDRRAQQWHDAAPELPELAVVRTWTTIVDRAEFSALARLERSSEALAVYLPLEVAIRSRGDPRDEVEDCIYSLLGSDL